MTRIILKSIKELNNWRNSLKKNINFVPTMGNLHEGHKKLIKKASSLYSNSTLVSIFLNPLQFDNKEDLKNYPKTFVKDIEIACESGANAIFIPSVNEIFPNHNDNIIFLKASKELSSSLCGIKRVGHFDGVCTVVNRLLDLINPETIFLGEKDWQQLIIIREMIKQKRLPVKVYSFPTVRDISGIPFSSRNSLLSDEGLEKLKFFSKELLDTQKLFTITKKLDLKKLQKKLKGNNLSIEYLEHVNSDNLKTADSSKNITLLAGAIVCDNTRLIDHVFLMKRKPIIAIDGPAGSGKSTVTKIIAKELDLLYLDTGAMYRALSWFLTTENINYNDNNELVKCLNNLSIYFISNGNSEQDIFINNLCVTNKIRTQEINSIVSSIAAISAVRNFLVSEQRKIGEVGGLVAEGRDIGTKVFPSAELKIYLTASINERARRRKLELENKGYLDLNFEDIKDQITKRDNDDSTRLISPLTKSKDAIEVISDNFSIQEIVEIIKEIYNEKIPKEIQT